MKKQKPGPETIAKEALRDLTAAFGLDLEAVTLYGSAVGPDYQSGISDINLLVVLTADGLARLGQLSSRAAGWPKSGIAMPLVLGPGELESSLDSFPLEFLNIKLNRKVLLGEDVMAGVEIDPADLRLQCERELRGKLLLLREAMLSTGGRDAGLKNAARASIKAFAAIFRGVLVLLGSDPAGMSARQVLEEAGRALNLDDAVVFTDIWDLGLSVKIKGKAGRGQSKELFSRYLAAAAQAAEKIDALEINPAATDQGESEQ